mmetsp:Transcript_46776/g.111353  ORF Transcript_46776/g.111353 Transcript_46776/m.111353 type:complete len:295 (-) Transcript_46776:711-1595(-)
MRNVATPAPEERRRSQHRCATWVFSTTMWLSAPHAVVMATSYLASIVPRSPKRPWMPVIFLAFLASMRHFITEDCALAAPLEALESSREARAAFTSPRSPASFSTRDLCSVLPSSSCFTSNSLALVLAFSSACLALRFGSASWRRVWAEARASAAFRERPSSSSISALTSPSVALASLRAWAHGWAASWAALSCTRSASVSSRVASNITSSTFCSPGISFSMFATIFSASSMAFSWRAMPSEALSPLSCSLVAVSASFLVLPLRCFMSSLYLMSLRSNTAKSSLAWRSSLSMVS